MKYFAVVLIICVGVSFVLPSSEHHQYENSHFKEKSHHERNQHHLSGRHHHQADVRHHQHHQRSHGFNHHAYRAKEEDQQCKWVCTEEPSNSLNIGLQAMFNSSSSLFGIVNKYSNIALIIDFQSGIILFINCKTEITFVINIKTQQVVRLQVPEASWDPSKTSFSTFFQQLSVPNLLKIAETKGQKLELNKLPETVTKELEEQLKGLGLPLPFKEALQLITSFSTYLKTPLSFLYQGSKAFDIPNHLGWFLKINSFLANLLQNEGFDLTKINIDPKNLFSGSSGIQVLVNLFSQLARHADLSKFVGSIVNSREKSLSLLSNLSSGSNNDLDGIITIVVSVIKVTSHQGSIGDVISSIIKYNSTGLDEPTWGQVINQALQIMKTQAQLFPQSDGSVQFIKFLEALNHNNLVINNIHIFDLLKIFFSPNLLDRIGTIIKVLSCFMPHRGIPAFFNFVKEVLNNTGNSSILTQLVPGLDISKFAGNGNALENILQGKNLTQLLSNGGNIQSALSNIPIFGQIAKQISSSLEGENLGQFLNPTHIQDIFTHGFSNLIPGGSNGVGGIASTIQKDLGGLFGVGSLGTNETDSGSKTTSDSSTDSSSSTEALPGSKMTTGLGADSSSSSDVASSSNLVTGSSTEKPASLPGLGQLLHGVPNLFGLRGNIGGGFYGNVDFEGRKANRRNRKIHRSQHEE